MLCLWDKSVVGGLRLNKRTLFCPCIKDVRRSLKNVSGGTFSNTGCNLVTLATVASLSDAPPVSYINSLHRVSYAVVTHFLSLRAEPAQ